MLDSLCLITSPRTGANHLMQLGENLAELQSFPELFAAFGDRLEPANALDMATAAASAAHKRVLVFKLWPDMLPVELLEHSILDRPGVRLVFVVRRQIDAYLSWCKAIELQQWRGIDTSGLRLTLDIDDFTAWMDMQQRWFDHWRSWLERRYLPSPILRYETDIDQPPASVLKRFAAAAAQVGVTLRVPAVLTTTGLERQDRIRVAADKASNWSEFSKALVQRGLEKRAFGHPV